jgi:hypothetical protein
MNGEQIAAMIRKKLAGNGGKIVIPRRPIRTVPRTTPDIRELTATRPDGWEYLLYGAILLRGIEEHQSDFRDNEIGYAASSGRYVSDDAELASFFKRKFQECARIINHGNRLLAPHLQARAFGAPGESGDPDLIIHMAERLVGVYAELLDWAAEIRGTSRPSEYNTIFELAAQWPNSSIRALKKFVFDYVAKMDRLSDRLDQGEKVHITHDYHFRYS